MSQIPSDIAASGVQAGSAAREAARPRDAERGHLTDAARRDSRAIDEAGRSVETTDSDTQVFTDSEGAGSQGRTFSEADQQPGAGADEPPGAGISFDADGRAHLDLEA